MSARLVLVNIQFDMSAIATDASDEDMKEVVRKYKTIGHPTAYMGLHALTRYYRGRYSRDKLKKALQSVNAYTILRHAQPDKKTNPIYVWRPRALLQVRVNIRFCLVLLFFCSIIKSNCLM